MLGISRAAETIGFRTLGVKIPFEKLRDEAPLPAIVHWNQNHFVVVYKISGRKGKERIHVADPAGGLVTFSREEFTRCWASTGSNEEPQGTALLLEPTPEFYSTDDEKPNRKSFGYLFRYLKPYHKLLLQLLLGLILGSLLQLIFPFLTQSIVDYGIGNRNISFIYLVLIAQLVLTLSRVSVEFIRGWILLHLGTRISVSLISDFLAKLMKCKLFRIIPLMVFCLTVSALLAYPFNLSGVPAYKNNPDSLSTAFNNRGVDYAIAGDYEKAGNCFFRSISILQLSSNENKRNIGAGYFNLANLKMLLGYSDSALVYYQSAVKYLSNNLKDKSSLASVYIEMGSCYYYRNEYHEASSFIQQGIALLQESSPVDNHRLVLANYKLCNVLTKLGQYEEAIKISVKNLVLAKRSVSSLNSLISNGIGIAYSHLNNYDRTLYYYKQAEHYSKENGSVNKDELASIYNNIGVFYKEHSKWVDAEQYLRKALACYQARGNNPVQTAQVLVNLGGVKLAQRRAQEALQLFVCAEKYNNKPLVNGTRKSGVVSRYLSPGLAASIFEGKGDAYVELNRLHERCGQ